MGGDFPQPWEQKLVGKKYPLCWINKKYNINTNCSSFCQTRMKNNYIFKFSNDKESLK